MQKSILLLVGVIIAFTTRLGAAEVFEGEYDMTLKSGRDTVETSIWVKDGHMRMKMSGQGEGAGEMIFRDGLTSMLILMPQQRMVMEMPIPKELLEAKIEANEGNKKMPFLKAGSDKEILGYKAQKFVWEEAGEKMVIYATDELGSMPFASNPMMKGWSEAFRKMTGLDAFFPLEAIGYENNKEAYRMTVTRVEKKVLPDHMFLPPKGYRQMNMPTGMPGFGGFGGQ